MEDNVASPTEWTPAVKIDLFKCSATAFAEAIGEFNEWVKDNPPKLSWHSGWYNITPEMSEDLLKRNKSNRKVSLATVQRYARDMLADQWRATGQGALINTAGEVFDVQHRAFGSYFSGATFPCYVVADVPVQDDLFAYLDAGKPRSAADALYTAGNDGLSSQIAAAIKIAWRYEYNGFGVIKQQQMRAMTSPEVLAYSRANPGLRDTAHLVMSMYPKAVSMIQAKGIAIFVAWKITELCGPEALEDFFLPLGSGANLAEDNPILALRNRLYNLDEDNELDNPRRLGLIIKAFDYHLHDRKVGKRGLILADNEHFPRFENIKPVVAEAAE